jgi:hypothetical protein
MFGREVFEDEHILGCMFLFVDPLNLALVFLRSLLRLPALDIHVLRSGPPLSCSPSCCIYYDSDEVLHSNICVKLPRARTLRHLKPHGQRETTPSHI